MPVFDPALVPVLAVDSHLPPIAAPHLQPQALVQRFAQARQARSAWQPEIAAEPAWDAAAVPTAAAVLVPLVQRERLQVLLTVRTAHLSSHAGQIAFPGGKVDAQDADAVATALREAQEEIGLLPAQVQVIGSLPLYTTGTGFAVTPVVALVQPPLALQPNPAEVAHIFEVPLDFLMNPAHHRHHRHAWADRERQWLSMPYQDGAQQRFIWGATAGMLRNLYGFLASP